MNYSRAFMRKHYASGYLISNDGLHGERDYYDQYSQEFKTQVLYQYLDPAEDRYFMLSGKDKYYIDEMVLSCYRGTIKDRQALSWRNFFCSGLLEYFEQEGNILLTPYLDDRFNTNKPYSSVIDNISKEFLKMTGDKDVKICFSEGFYDMYL